MPVLTGNDLPNTALDSIQYYHHCLSKTLPSEREPRHSNTIIIVLHQITQMVIIVRGRLAGPQPQYEKLLSLFG